MKKLFALLLTLCLALAAPACAETAAPAQPEADEAHSDTLVAYFSATGTTRTLAQTIADTLGADLFEIVPADPYTQADLNYNSNCRANDEQQDDGARPAIAPDCVVENWADYDVVLLGHPIWWGIPPKILRTFAESYDWSGKTVAGFCTSGGSGYSNAGLPELTEGAVWLEGRRFSGAAAAEEILEWVQELPLELEEETAVQQIQVSFQGYTYVADLADNSSAEAFVQLLEENGGSLTVSARDYGNFEKVGELPRSLPQNDEPLDTVAGDLILYQGSSIVLYYSTNSWTFTRLGWLEGDLSGLKEQLGEGDVEITYTLLP